MTELPLLSSVFIVCSDLERSLDFYSKLGFEIAKTKSRSHILRTGGELEIHLHGELTVEEMAQYGVSQEPGSASVVHSFLVNHLQKVLSALPTDSVISPPHLTAWGHTIALVRDPDGHRLELRQRD